MEAPASSLVKLELGNEPEHEDFALVFLRVLRVFVVKCFKLMRMSRGYCGQHARSNNELHNGFQS